MEEEKGLTIEKLKMYKGFENLSDKEAEEIIYGIRRFAHITYKYFTLIKETEKKNCRGSNE